MVSVIPTGGGAAGYTMPLPDRDEMFITKGKMMQDVIVSLGGRIAESLIFDDVTTGASQDIKQATATAKDMVTKYGFSDDIGMINYADEDEVLILVIQVVATVKMLPRRSIMRSRRSLTKHTQKQSRS